MTTYTYKITKKNHIRNAYSMILYTLLLLIGMIWIMLDNSIDGVSYTISFVSFFSIQFFFWVIIHLNYYTVNKNDEFIYDTNSGKFTFINNSQIVSFTEIDIVKVTEYKSYALHKGNIKLLAWDDYNHVKIKLNNKRTIIITNLLTGGEIVMPIDKTKIKTKLSLFRFINTKSLTETS